LRGIYCIIIDLPKAARIRVGSLGEFEFRRGIYVYVGSALSGMESRVRRHRSISKKVRWHIDYLLAEAEVRSVISIPSADKSVECAVAKSLLKCEDATVPVRGFGSSDCSCDSHLIYLGDSDPEWIAEEISMRISMFPGMYQREFR
jgi:Uri superfamily endonuclease